MYLMPSSSFQKWVGMEGKGFVQTSSPLSSYTCLPAGEAVGKRREGAERKEQGGRKEEGGREVVEERERREEEVEKERGKWRL